MERNRSQSIGFVSKCSKLGHIFSMFCTTSQAHPRSGLQTTSSENEDTDAPQRLLLRCCWVLLVDCQKLPRRQWSVRGRVAEKFKLEGWRRNYFNSLLPLQSSLLSVSPSSFSLFAAFHISKERHKHKNEEVYANNNSGTSYWTKLNALGFIQERISLFIESMINDWLSEMAIEWMRGDEFDLCFLREMRERTSDVPAKKYFNNQTSLNESIDISEIR